MQADIVLERDNDIPTAFLSKNRPSTDGLNAAIAFCGEMGAGYTYEDISEADDGSAITIRLTFPGDSPRFTHEASAAWDRALYNAGVRRRVEPQT